MIVTCPACGKLCDPIPCKDGKGGNFLEWECEDCGNTINTKAAMERLAEQKEV